MRQTTVSPDASPRGFAPPRFDLSSADLPEAERLPAMKRLLADNILDAHVECLGGQPFEASVSAIRVGAAICADCRSTPLLVHHTRAHVEPARRKRIVIQALTEGKAAYFEDGKDRSGETVPGDLSIVESGMVGGFVCEVPVRVVSLAMPYAAIVPWFATARAFDRPLERTNFAARLLFDLVTGLARGELGHARHATVADAVGSLIALAFDGMRGERLDSESRRASRLSAIRDHLVANYADPTLTPAQVAEKFRISVRYLHMLMEDTGRSFREELLRMRLNAALRMLLQGSASERTVADIAYGVGFNDLSQFNRNFRARFGITPSEARRLSQTSSLSASSFHSAPRRDGNGTAPYRRQNRVRS